MFEAALSELSLRGFVILVTWCDIDCVIQAEA